MAAPSLPRYEESVSENGAVMLASASTARSEASGVPTATFPDALVSD